MMANNEKVLTPEAEQALLAPINTYVEGIQQKINALRLDGTDKVLALNNHIAIVKENANYTKAEKADIIAQDKKKLTEAKKTEEQNKEQINSLVADAVGYLNTHYEQDYYSKVAESCAAQKAEEIQRYEHELEELKKQHESDMAGLTGKGEIKDEKYVYKNRLFDAKLKHESVDERGLSHASLARDEQVGLGLAA